jgi:amidase
MTLASLYALRPLETVPIPIFSYCDSFEGQEAIQSILGPISSCIAALRLFTKTVVDSIRWNLDQACPRLPWNAECRALRSHGGPGVKLCFAIMWDDDVVKPTPAMK